MKVLNSYVKSYIQNLRFALTHGAKINFQEKRLVDENRPEKYTNQYTVRTLFPDENPVDALKSEYSVAAKPSVRKNGNHLSG